ncbi:MAG: DUF21 domain-containing protein [Chitinivibrionia bacterium]|nr:DUF21 domain-containing protein [Chitinivibrionia bacterium]
MVAYFLLFIFAWVVSFFCSGYEAGFLSVSEFKINALAQKGNKSAKIMTTLLKNKEKVLTTLLIGNTITLVLLTFAFGKIIFGIFQEINALLQTIILTAFVFITCELFPKSLFRIYSFELTYKLSYFIYPIYILFLPISSIFKLISSKFSKNGETLEQDYKLHDVAAEGVRRRLLPIGVSILVNKFKNKTLSLQEICINVQTTGVRGEKNVALNPAQPIEEIIKSKLLFNCDTVECDYGGNKKFYYPTAAILDAFFRK